MKTSELRSSIPSVLALVLVVFAGAAACRDSTPPPFDDVDVVGTGGRSGTGGRRGGAAAGGAAGAAVPPKGGAAGAAPSAPPAADGAVADSAPIIDVAEPADVLVPVTPVDAVAVVDVIAPADVAAPKGPAACHPDPKVIEICHQLEAACQNCPGGAMGTVATKCFAAVQKNNDAACAKFAVDNKCPPDDAAGKGNVCGSLNCGVGNGPPVAAGCNKVMCAKAQGEGDSAKCMPFLAACPCK
jgi:hypothetical protein